MRSCDGPSRAVILFPRFMKGLRAETDFVVIGADVAGLRAAIELAESGRVLVVAKREIPDFKASDAKSEAAWLGDEDEILVHLQDTLDAGDGLCNPAAVKILVEEGAERIEELTEWGKHSHSNLLFELESARSKSRVLHSHGESTPKEVLRVLCDKAHSLKSISYAQFTFVTDLAIDAGQVTGVVLLDEKGVPQQVACSAVLLATGGIGQIYRNTTNPETSTADG